MLTLLSLLATAGVTLAQHGNHGSPVSSLITAIHIFVQGCQSLMARSFQTQPTPMPIQTTQLPSKGATAFNSPHHTTLHLGALVKVAGKLPTRRRELS